MTSLEETAHSTALSKAIWRLIPFLFLIYVVAYVDRVNVGFAQLQMKSNLHLSDKVYGTGAGIFFIGYFLFEVPSNLILARVGARRWITRIMISWGLVAMAMMFIRNPPTFYLLRFLLGAMQVGFFPGILLYMTDWFTAQERAGLIARFMTANAVAWIIGGPLSGWLLSQSGKCGLMGWQWLFLVEGLPAILLSGVVLRYLPDGPQHAKWLTPQEQQWLIQRVQQEDRTRSVHGTHSLGSALSNPELWLLAAIYFALVVGMYGISLWMPLIIKSFSGLSDQKVGLLTALPYVAAGITMVLSGSHSDRTGERRFHITIPAILGGAALAASATMHSPVTKLLALAVATSGMWATLGPFWSMPPRFLGGTAAAGGIAIINSVGNLGGFVGPYMVGYIKESAQRFVPHHASIPDFAYGLYFLAGSTILGGLLALATRQKSRV